MASAPDPTKVFNEKLNGRIAMLGLTIGLVTEWITGQGIIQQVFGIFNWIEYMDYLLSLNLFESNFIGTQDLVVNKIK